MYLVSQRETLFALPARKSKLLAKRVLWTEISRSTWLAFCTVRANELARWCACCSGLLSSSRNNAWPDNGIPWNRPTCLSERAVPISQFKSSWQHDVVGVTLNWLQAASLKDEQCFTELETYVTQKLDCRLDPISMPTTDELLVQFRSSGHTGWKKERKLLTFPVKKLTSKHEFKVFCDGDDDEPIDQTDVFLSMGTNISVEHFPKWTWTKHCHRGVDLKCSIQKNHIKKKPSNPGKSSFVLKRFFCWLMPPEYECCLQANVYIPRPAVFGVSQTKWATAACKHMQ